MPLQRDYSTAPIQVLKPGTATQINITSSSVATPNAVGASVVRICATVACRIAVGSAPTATSSGTYLPANVPEYVAVYPGVDKIAVIREAVDGLLSITEMG